MNTYEANSSKKVVSPLAAWIKRRRVISRLSALDNRMLDDIGIQRYQIKEIAEQTSPRVSLKEYASALLAEFRNEMKYLRSARQLVALDDRMLADIGLHRSDIPGALRGDLPFRTFAVPSIMSVSKSDMVHSIPDLATDSIKAPVNDDERSIAA